MTSVNEQAAHIPRFSTAATHKQQRNKDLGFLSSIPETLPVSSKSEDAAAATVGEGVKKKKTRKKPGKKRNNFTRERKNSKSQIKQKKRNVQSTFPNAARHLSGVLLSSKLCVSFKTSCAGAG